MGKPEGASWLVNEAVDLKYNAIWFSPMTETSGIEKPIANSNKVLGGSYYATRDHFKLDTDITCGDAEKDREHMRHFCQKAEEKGVRVYADLVFNHVAADHPLVFAENKEIAELKAKIDNKYDVIHSDSGKVIGLSYKDGAEDKKFFFKFRRTEELDLLFGGPKEDPWTDVAQINYSSPEARRYFVYGDENHKALFKQVIDWHIDNGFKNFRCDAAYLIPPESWSELIGYAHKQTKDPLFLAETLCLDDKKVQRLSQAKITGADGKERPAFDLGMLGFYWWNFKDDWLPKDENKRVQKMSTHGGAGSPDTHDTETTLAGSLAAPFKKLFNDVAKSQAATAQISVRNYAISALCCNSHYAQMGYEYCNTKQNHVFKGQVSPADRLAAKLNAQNTPLDIRDQIRAINQLKEDMHVENCRVDFKEHAAVDGLPLVKIRVEFVDVDTNQKKADIVIIMNEKPEAGPVTLNGKSLESLGVDGLSRLAAKPMIYANPTISDVLIFHTPIVKTPAAEIAPPARKVSNGPKP